jgi:hypothetical protein
VGDVVVPDAPVGLSEAGCRWWLAAWSSSAAEAWGEEHLPQLTRLARLLDEEREAPLSARRMLAATQLEHRLGLSLSGLARLRRDDVLAAQAAADGEDEDVEFAALVAEVGYGAAFIERAHRDAYSPASLARWARLGYL